VVSNSLLTASQACLQNSNKPQKCLSTENFGEHILSSSKYDKEEGETTALSCQEIYQTCKLLIQQQIHGKVSVDAPPNIFFQ
jgi:hypothetical protein